MTGSSAPNAETGDERDLWLDRVVAIGHGCMLSGFEVSDRVYPSKALLWERTQRSL